MITCGSSQGENSSIGSKDQVMELRKAEEAEEHDKTDNTTQIPAIAGMRQFLVCFESLVTVLSGVRVYIK